MRQKDRVPSPGFSALLKKVLINVMCRALRTNRLSAGRCFVLQSDCVVSRQNELLLLSLVTTVIILPTNDNKLARGRGQVVGTLQTAFNTRLSLYCQPVTISAGWQCLLRSKLWSLDAKSQNQAQLNCGSLLACKAIISRISVKLFKCVK